MYQCKDDVDMLNAVKSVLRVCSQLYGVQHIDTLYVLAWQGENCFSVEMKLVFSCPANL